MFGLYGFAKLIHSWDPFIASIFSRMGQQFAITAISSRELALNAWSKRANRGQVEREVIDVRAYQMLALAALVALAALAIAGRVGPSRQNRTDGNERHTSSQLIGY